MSTTISSERIRELATAHVKGSMHLVHALKRDPAGQDGYDGGNLVALLEWFATSILSEISQSTPAGEVTADAETSSDPACKEPDGCPTEGAVLRREWRALTQQVERLTKRLSDEQEAHAALQVRCFDSGPTHSSVFYQVEQLKAEIAQNAGNTKDAERYRLLRGLSDPEPGTGYQDPLQWKVVAQNRGDGRLLFDIDLDTELDNAIAAQAKQAEGDNG